MREETEAAACAGAVPSGVEIIEAAVQIAADRAVHIAGPEDHKEEVDEIRGIEEVLQNKEWRERQESFRRAPTRNGTMCKQAPLWEAG